MELTKAEEQIMKILWKIDQGFVKDVLAHFKDPKPAYTTVATMLKIMEKKGFVAYKSYGNAYRYHPLISKEDYSEKHLAKVFSRHFDSSIKDVVTFFTDNSDVDISDIDEAIQALLEIKKRKS